MLNVQRNSKPYWSILKTFLNNTKVPIIPPLFYENEFVTDFKKKAERFNSFLAEQCSLKCNDTKLLSRLHYFTEECLSTTKFSSNDKFDIIQQLNPNKAHSDDMINIRMLKIFGKSICRPLELIFNEYILNCIFPIRMKKGESSAYSQEKRQLIFRKLPSCLVTTNLWQNPRTFHILWNIPIFYL